MWGTGEVVMYSNERLFWNWAQVNCKFMSAGCQCPLCLLSVSLRTQSQRLPAETYEHHLLTASCTSKGWCLAAKPVCVFTGRWNPLEAPQPLLSTAALQGLVHSAVSTQQRGSPVLLQPNAVSRELRGTSHLWGGHGVLGHLELWSRKKLASSYCWAGKLPRAARRSSRIYSLHWTLFCACPCTLRTGVGLVAPDCRKILADDVQGWLSSVRMY